MSLDLTPAEVGIVDDELLPPLPVAEPVMARRTLWIMSAACGVTVANSYYNQPLLSDFQAYFHTSAERASLVATAAQVGYGTGIFFLVPLGDLMERRRLVLTILCLCAALLLGMAMAPTIQALIAFQLVVAITGVSAQLLIPFGIELTPPEKRGSTVGVLMAGLLCGILLARTVAGLLGDYFGWRSAYFVGCGATADYGGHAVCRSAASAANAEDEISAAAALHDRSDPHAAAALAGVASWSALSFGGFTAFWTTLSFLMKSRFGYGAGAAGMFGIVGLVGALAAPLAGKLSDRPRPTLHCHALAHLLRRGVRADVDLAEHSGPDHRRAADGPRRAVDSSRGAIARDRPGADRPQSH